MYRNGNEVGSYVEGRGDFQTENAMQFRGRSMIFMFSLVLRAAQRRTLGFTGTAGTMFSQVSHNWTITIPVRFKACFITGGI